MKQSKFQFGKLRAILILAAIVIIGMGSTTLLSNDLTLVYNGEEAVYNTTSKTVEEFLGERNINIEENMYLDPALDTPITSEMKITARSPKEIIVLDDGVEKTVTSGFLTVGEVLEQHGYELKAKDYTVPSVEENINFDTKGAPLVVVNRVYQQTNTDVVSIPFESETRENPEMLKGQSKVVVEGQNGSKVVTTSKTIENGEVIYESVLSEEITTHPVNKVTEIGTKIPEPPKPAPVASSVSSNSNSGGTSSSNSGSGYINGRKILRTITMNATAYDASYASNGKWAGVTALGTKLRPGVVAVDRNVIPLGTSLYIESNDSWPSYGMAVAEDVGGAIKGNKIDLFFESASTVRSFGRRTVTVHVLAP